MNGKDPLGKADVYMSKVHLFEGPAIIHVGKENTARPEVYAKPSPSDWPELARKQHGDELRVHPPQNLNTDRLREKPFPIAPFRNAESSIVSLRVKDVDSNVLQRYVFNTDPETVETSPARYTINLERGIRVHTHSLLLRFVSPWDTGKNLQVWFPQVVMNEEIDLTSMKGGAPVYTLEWMAEVHATSGIGIIEIEG